MGKKLALAWLERVGHFECEPQWATLVRQNWRCGMTKRPVKAAELVGGTASLKDYPLKGVGVDIRPARDRWPLGSRGIRLKGFGEQLHLAGIQFSP